MKVGDLVKWENVLNADMDRYQEELGLVIKMSKTGHSSESARVLFNDGEAWWVDTQRLALINESW